MTIAKRIGTLVLAGVVGITGLEAGAWLSGLPMIGVVSEAQARVGRPLTPVSVAGVARRTTRRTVRRTAVVVSALPAGCAGVSINGGAYYRCGATYYQPQGNAYVVVNID